MTRIQRFLSSLFAFALVLEAPAAQADTTYIVQEGDTCLGIAIRILGDRDTLAKIHQLNPQLGKSPHDLVVGSTLILPDLAAKGPDARLTRANGDVKIRFPSAAQWNAAQRGMDLFRAYRVGAASHASAEVTFADDALLGMRERTIVVIYGPEKRLAKVLTATAELENGTLESRLGELDGKPVLVRTKAGEAELRGNTVVVTTSDKASTVSNHGGKAVELRGKTRRRSAVKVAAGMGTRVEPGKAPEPPRPLPEAPAWRSAPGPRLAAADGTIALAWDPSPRATHYRVAVRDRNGDLVAASLVTATAIDLALAPGAYQISISAFDADGLESVPAPALAVTRVAPTLIAPDGQPVQDAKLPSRVTEGTVLLAPEGFRCAVADAAPSTRVVLDRPGRAAIRCRELAGVAALDPIEIDVVAIERPAIAARAPAAEPAPARTRHTELGVYTGFHTVALQRSPVKLGGDGDAAHALDDGSTFGIRLGRFERGVGFEAELGMSALQHVDTRERGLVGTLAVHGALRGRDGANSFALLGGLGLSTVVSDAMLETYRVVPAWSWGLASSFGAGPWALRIDLRHSMSVGYDAIGHALQATVGTTFDLDR